MSRDDDERGASGADGGQTLFERVVRRALPDASVASVADAGPSWNRTTRVARVTFDHREPVYCKVTPDAETATELRAEAGTLRYVAANTPVSVPRVVATTRDPVPGLLTAPVAGDAVSAEWHAEETTTERRETLARRLGRTLATTHEERFERPGTITDGDADGLAVDHAPWPDVVAADVRENRRHAETDRFDAAYERLLDAIESERDRLTDGPARLLHCDPATPNCFDTGDDRLTLLDWGNAEVGDPARDVARARVQALASLRESPPTNLVEAFHAGYRDVAGSLPDGLGARGPVYEAVIQLGTAGYVERFAEWRTESVAELTEWFHEDLDRRLSQIE
ncbi:phosphotransferase family protein [Halobaculum sp. MBLA0147]|uniref:phosphotransferase family protein n=1 Tax=Halobaculum sp. MBLA0147 TaxID=3079934 RepID=UPI00352509BF